MKAFEFGASMMWESVAGGNLVKQILSKAVTVLGLQSCIHRLRSHVPIIMIGLYC